MSSFFNKFRKDISGIAWFALSLFLTLALASFHPEDPSFNALGASGPVLNYCGYIGSFLADLLLQIFGVSAWIWPIAALRMSASSFQNRETLPTRNNVVLGVLLISNISSLLALYMQDTALFNGEIPVGGLLGTLLSQVLVKMFNRAGVAIILWSAALIFIIYYTQKPLKEFLAGPKQHLRKLFASIDRLAIEPAWSYLSGLRLKNPESVQERFIPVSENKKIFDEPEEAVENELAKEKEAKPLHFVIEDARAPKKEAAKQKEVFKKISRRIENWELPKLSMLEDPPFGSFKVDQRLMAKNTQLLEDKLAQFNVKGQVVAVRPGPAVTMFEFKPNADVKISRITELADDLSLALSSESVRIIAPLPGRDVVGIETSNPKRETVYLREVLEDPAFWDEKTKLPVALGKQANGETKIVDLRKMPHMLVAGTTGSGKSVFVVSLITGLLFKHSPKTLRLILIDPKQVDLAAFYNVPHLLMPPIREPKKAVSALKWAIREMEKRYRSMSKFGARGLESFNEIVTALNKSDYEKYEQEAQQVEETSPHNTFYYTTLPYIVVVVEEFGDLMAVDKQNVEHAVVRLAQMARACGIHLVLAMQSPRKDVVTGLIKTNIPGRISFKVASKMDSRIILDESGAERLLANGDMLFQAPGISKPERHHGGWLPEKDIQQVTSFWAGQAEPDYDRAAMKMLEGSGGGFDLTGEDIGGSSENEYDEMYDEILAWVSGQKEVSASLLQRRFRLGYPRAARMIEVFEKEGVVGPSNGSKARQVLVSKL